MGSAKYATCTYPLAESAAIAGAGRAHPRTLWSVESAITGAFHVFPLSFDFATSNTPLLSSRIDHHAARMALPARIARTDAGHAPRNGDIVATEMFDGR